MPDQIATRCCIVGGGPAGMMLGFLLARAGVDVVVLEKHADFLRDFRGDTIHPSTLEIMHELGLLEAFLRLPHQELRTLAGLVGDNILAQPLRAHAMDPRYLRAVQKRREFPTRVTQAIQILVQIRVIASALGSTLTPKPPFAAKLLNWLPWLRRIPARLLGLGIRPEHVRTPEAAR
jgi:2-polyprenyl-6-methoxyphenol hydroxylase-like FAD-dependent oxidoreductase